MRLSLDETAAWTAYIVITLAAVCGLFALGVLAHDSISVSRAKDECGAAGGTVDIYGKRDEFWRCVKQAERAP